MKKCSFICVCFFCLVAFNLCIVVQRIHAASSPSQVDELIEAAHSDDIVKLFLQKGANINTINDDKQSVLEYVIAGKNKVAMVAFLKEQNAKPSPKMQQASMELNKPLMGEKHSFKPNPTDRFIVNFPLHDAILERKNSNFIISFADGTYIELIDFYKIFNMRNVPEFIIEGQSMPGDILFDTLSHTLSLEQ